MPSTSPTRCDFLAISGVAATATLLPGQFAPAAEGATVRPFNISLPEEALVDLGLRLAATCWPDKETVSHRAQPPESWVWRAYRNLIYFHEVDRAVTLRRGSSPNPLPPNSARRSNPLG